MFGKIIGAVMLASFCLAVSTPVVVYAAGAPKTKADCEKHKNMQWDATTGKCVKK